MRELVSFVVALVEVAGGFERAAEWTNRMQTGGLRALDEAGLTTDVRLLLKREARRLGLVTDDGDPVRSRIAELAIVLDVVSAVPPPRKPEARSEPLVFTVPAEAGDLLTPAERLDTLVADVVRSAVQRVHLGGPFWNAKGFALLDPVLRPALEVRGVRCDFYAVRQGDEWDHAILSFVDELHALGGHVRLWWYAGHEGSLMHAKFCVADATVGYFGSANLTSFGLGEHVEIGVKLTAMQCTELLKLIEALTRAGLFVSAA